MASISIWWVLVIPLFISSNLLTTGSALNMEMSPQNYTTVFDRTVEMSCYTNKMDASVEDLLILEIGRKGDKPLAVIHQDETVAYPNSDKAYLQLQSVGLITNDKSKQSYLNVTLTEPRKGSDEGLYECTMYYRNEAGKVESTVVGRTLSVIDPDVRTLRRVLKSMVSRVERLNTQIKTLTHTQAVSVAAEAPNNGSVFMVEKKFWIDEWAAPAPGHRAGVRFYTADGGAEQVFTAPEAGLYTFDVALQAPWYRDYFIQFVIRYNGRAMVSAVLEVAWVVPRSAFTSLTLCLRRGDKIENVPVEKALGHSVTGVIAPPVLPITSRFSGRFVRPC